MYLGFDTSNYTTSVCLITDNGKIYQEKKLLDVKKGEKGLRQSDAVFQHTVNLPKLIKKLSRRFDFNLNIDAVSVSSKPRNVEGSYMPCFLTGVNTAYAVSAFSGTRYYETSHQIGHILAVLYSENKLDIITNPFIALHLSGGTTEVLLVEPDDNEIIKAKIIARSLDLKAGQAIDRTGVMLGLNFPCGAELDKLSLKSDKIYKHKPSVKGVDISLSGVENKAANLIKKGELPQDVAKFVLTYLTESVLAMLENVFKENGTMPVVFSGGVSSNTILRNAVSKKYDAIFAQPQYSCDNALGVAVYGYLKDKFNE